MTDKDNPTSHNSMNNPTSFALNNEQINQLVKFLVDEIPPWDWEDTDTQESAYEWIKSLLLRSKISIQPKFFSDGDLITVVWHEDYNNDDVEKFKITFIGKISRED